MGKEPTITSLSQPIKAEELLNEQRRSHDCMPCRLVGGTAFIGLGAYSYWEGTKQLERNRATILASKPMIGIQGRRTALAGISLGMVWMGIYRLFG